MRIIESQHIDEEKWNSLVESTKEASFFSYAWYLNATAENWCALVDDNYSFGIALPYTKRFGVEQLYTPIFVRYIEMLGTSPNLKEVERAILDRFQNVNVAAKQKILGGQFEVFIYQSIDNNVEIKKSTQLKKMLRLAKDRKLTVSISDSFEKVLEKVKAELKVKDIGLGDGSMSNLDKLIRSTASAGILKTYELNESGGIFCLESDTEMLYLKGAVEEVVKNNGGMYLALSTAIENALEKGKNFDLGGSRIPGVKQFNHKLGGKDQVYYSYTIDNAPYWFKFARSIKKIWSKR